MQYGCEIGLEGIVAKRKDAPYRGGRQAICIKVRCVRSMYFPVIGYVPAQPDSIAAIRLARAKRAAWSDSPPPPQTTEA